MKKLVGGLKIFRYLLFLILIVFSNTLQSSQIFDYQSENFINKIISDVISVNSYKKKIKYKIINDEFPNAFVTEDNTLFLTSGLFSYSPDYVSFLAVVAHEIGHIEKYHISKRIKEIDNLKNVNSLGNMTAIFGSMILQQPNLINAAIVNQTRINNLYLNFSQEQEIEADFYSIETIKKLNLPTTSIKEFLVILEKKSKSHTNDNELKKFSTHPLFSTRHDIIDNNAFKNFRFNNILNQEFNFIKAKFMAYTDNGFPDELDEDYKIYYYAVQFSKSGELLESLKNINFLITKYNNKIFLLETKADILLSYGYNIEALQFYKKVLDKQPSNLYAQYNILMNIDFQSESFSFNENIFNDYQNLIYNFPNNKIILTRYYNLSKILNYEDWINFFEVMLFSKDSSNEKLLELKQTTKDNNLKKIIKLYN